jgi:GT2 family glycosyltransferase
MVEKKKFEIAGGFDEDLPVAYNDVDLCFKLFEKGYYNVLRTDAIFIHHESLSRGSDETSEKTERRENELEKLYEKHPALRGRDPFYNNNLIKNGVDFQIGLPADLMAKKSREG